MATMKVKLEFEVEGDRTDILLAEVRDVYQRLAHSPGLSGAPLETDVRDRRGLQVGSAEYEFGTTAPRKTG
jgi:hypothetical protein